MVGIHAAEVIDMQRNSCMIDQPLKELMNQVNIKFTNGGTRKRHIENQTGTTRQINHYSGQGFIQRNIGMPIAAQALFITQGFGQRLAESNAYIFYRVMCINMQIAHSIDHEINHAMAGNLIEHVIKKSHAGGELGNTCAIQIDGNANTGFEGITRNVSLPHGSLLHAVEQEQHDTIAKVSFSRIM